MQDHAPPIPPVLQALRLGTRAAHAAVERLPAMAALTDEGLTEAAYVEALRGLFRFHASLRGALRRGLATFGAPAEIAQAPVRALAADLAWFGVPAWAGMAAELRFASLPEVLGARYVLDGSALGGRVIARHIGPRLGVAAGRGASFFCGVSAADARGMWADLCAALADLPETAGEDAVRGARAAFDHFATCLAGPDEGGAESGAERPMALAH